MWRRKHVTRDLSVIDVGRTITAWRIVGITDIAASVIGKDTLWKSAD
jgi:hypothetical protein